jgi:hypothetical protein
MAKKRKGKKVRVEQASHEGLDDEALESVAGGTAVANQSETGLRVGFDQTVMRQTPSTDFGSKVKSGLSQGADASLTAGQAAAPFVPGGAVISSAISGLSSSKSSGGSAGG